MLRNIVQDILVTESRKDVSKNKTKMCVFKKQAKIAFLLCESIKKFFFVSSRSYKGTSRGVCLRFWWNWNMLKRIKKNEIRVFLTVLLIILICSVRRLETEWEKRSEKTILLHKECSWINMHILRARAHRESRARSDAPSATSSGELASIARRCSSTNNFYSKYDPFFFSTAYF